MKKVKIVVARNTYVDPDDYYAKSVISENISDWEEISDEDYKFLMHNRRYLPGNDKDTTIILEQDSIPVKLRIDGIVKAIKTEQDKFIKEEAAREAIKKKKAETRLKKELERKQALLDQLRKEMNEQGSMG